MHGVRSLTRYSRFTLAVLAYNILVIVYGAFVRATGSGAGCGSHWPLCNGVVIPQAPAVETIIEFTHRVSSGGVLILIAILIIWTWRVYPKGSWVRRGAGFAALFTVTESLLGAGLVLFNLVAHNASLTRAFSMMLHLVNTFLLLASITITALISIFGEPEKLHPRRDIRWVATAGAVGLLILGASGAIAALGDTLFPSGSLAEGIAQDFIPTAHFLLRLRIFHPIIAVAAGLGSAAALNFIARRSLGATEKKAGRLLAGLVAVQLVLGAINVILLAPVWMQLLHLLMTTLIWITYVFGSVLGLVASYLPVRVGDQEVHNPVNQSPTG